MIPIGKNLFTAYKNMSLEKICKKGVNEMKLGKQMKTYLQGAFFLMFMGSIVILSYVIGFKDFKEVLGL